VPSVFLLRTRPARPHRLSLAGCALLLLALRAEAASPGPPDACPADSAAAVGRDDVWTVSTRRLPAVCSPPATARVAVERLAADPDARTEERPARTGGRRWERSDLESLLAEQTRPLIVFIHGNRYDHGDARSQGALLAARMAACCPDTPPAQTVIFSWPSEQQGILLRDGRAKLDRARADAHYLAWLLGRVDPARPVAIVGYSFGAIISLGALDDLATGRTLLRSDAVSWADRPGRTHLVLVAPAVRCDCLAARGPHRQAALCLDRLTLVINSEDEALRFFPLLEHDDRVQALGEVGMPRRWLPPGVEFSSTNAAPLIGRQHSFLPYLGSNALSRRICVGAGEAIDAAPTDDPAAGRPLASTDSAAAGTVDAG
jgi:hypothetical protein